MKMEFPTYEEFGKKVAEKALDEYKFQGKTLRDWIKIITEQEPKTDDDCISRQEAIENIRHAQVNFSVESDIDFTKHKREVQEIADGILNAQIQVLEKLPSITPQEPKTDDDCISRKDAIKIVDDMLMGERNHKILALEQLEELPAVKPKLTVEQEKFIKEHSFRKTVQFMNEILDQEPKTGRWIDSVTCSCCGWEFIDDVLQSPNMVWFPYCPNCGAKMEVEHE